jgi:hypothetical protein
VAVTEAAQDTSSEADHWCPSFRRSAGATHV